MNINDFIYGMKVTQNGEFGVVIKAEPDRSNLCGIIRWDNSRENDTEDWRGQYGTFIQLGGKILDDNYSFQFINDDGSLKAK
jgi:CO dehydrogenase/acetyl-CoA synthase beta subunit